MKLSPEILFETSAFQVSPPDKPFLYTSGLIGPFYINTHFLCGGKENAERILQYLDQTSSEPKKIVNELPGLLEEIISCSSIYRSVLDNMLEVVKEGGYLQKNVLVSGGQRRDWFFSVPLAKRLGLEHLYLFNDLSILDERGEVPASVSGRKSLHFADLLTLGSSYTQKWIPALKALGVEIILSLNAVDRLQGGEKNLKDAGVRDVLSLFKIDKEFFDKALNLKIVNKDQYDLLISFINDNYNSMRDFLLSNPDFIKNILSLGDEKAKKRVGQMLDGDLYNLN